LDFATPPLTQNTWTARQIDNQADMKATASSEIPPWVPLSKHSTNPPGEQAFMIQSIPHTLDRILWRSQPCSAPLQVTGCLVACCNQSPQGMGVIDRYPPFIIHDELVVLPLIKAMFLLLLLRLLLLVVVPPFFAVVPCRNRYHSHWSQTFDRVACEMSAWCYRRNGQWFRGR